MSGAAASDVLSHLARGRDAEAVATISRWLTAAHLVVSAAPSQPPVLRSLPTLLKAAHDYPNGFTQEPFVSPDTDEFPTPSEGYSVTLAGTDASISSVLLEDPSTLNVERREEWRSERARLETWYEDMSPLLSCGLTHPGGWRGDGRFEVNVTVVVRDLLVARALALAQDQIAIYDLNPGLPANSPKRLIDDIGGTNSLNWHPAGEDGYLRGENLRLPDVLAWAYDYDA